MTTEGPTGYSLGGPTTQGPTGYPIGYWLKRLDRAIDGALDAPPSPPRISPAGTGRR